MSWHMYFKSGELLCNNEIDNDPLLRQYIVHKLHLTLLDKKLRFLCQWNHPIGKCTAIAIKDLDDSTRLILMLTGHEIITLPDNACDELIENNDFYSYYKNFTQELLAQLRNEYYF